MTKNEDNTLRTLAEDYLGGEMSDLEYQEAKVSASRKLERIISREGDLGGDRREPWYLAQLIEEAVRAMRFSTYAEERSREIAIRRQAACVA